MVKIILNLIQLSAGYIQKVRFITINFKIKIQNVMNTYYIFYLCFNMDRKLREINGSYVITIPKQVCDLYSFKPNDKFSIEPIGNNELRLKKL